ncbi:acetolactate synthase [Solemya pervernicosa gill symbiont]|uniref:Acetolactate synthase n=2 Tax=Gammaproteobacteria incertae sedis TaxID=118884 RepID=A0A1T2LA26_9GAMM|nr:thiamine pyrophosphate-binding protein [Candidatus Reidiella endopervernicosa]OOZ41958.1 acetolactate synthase [Solemya pervernicosa gill symbiont]QKQ24927.1 thiamine pyrophosphate-binding protein [Candidatus Reidiella endopervernicosa]
MKIKVSELIVRYLERLGIEVIFGMPGAHILPVYDALYTSDIESVLVKHEQGAAFMAGGYARDSGKVSACIATAGPGATNLVTGIANAYADKQPILVITGETPTHIFGKGGLQESSGEGGSIDQVSLFKGITRYNRIIERTDYLAQVLTQATKRLLSPCPGPVLLSFPYNVQKELVNDSILDQIKFDRPAHTVYEESPQVDTLTDLIVSADNPVIVAGYGAISANAHDEISRLSEQLKIPVTTSLKAKGIISEQSPLSLGSLGVTSSGHAYKYITEKADLIVVLGAGFNERTSYLWDEKLLKGCKIAQVDSDQEQLEKVFTAEVAINGDIKTTLTGVLNKLAQRGIYCETSGLREQSIVQLKDSSEKSYSVFQSGFSLVEHFFSQLESHFPTDAVVFDDNIIFAQNFFNVTSANRYYPNSGISSLGHAIPAAIGASFYREVPMFAILGDGGFQMCCMEIMTAVNYNKPLNIVMFNNESMGLIRKNQHQQYEQRFINCDFNNPDYAYLARSFGINHQRIEQNSDIDALFSTTDLRGTINLIEIVIDKNVFPNYSSRR